MRMPRVSGRFDSAAKYLMVCGLPSSRTSKSVFGQVGNECAMLVFDVEEKSDDVDADFQGFRGRLLVLGFLGVGRLLGRGSLSASLGRGTWGRRSLGHGRWSAKGEEE